MTKDEEHSSVCEVIRIIEERKDGTGRKSLSHLHQLREVLFKEIKLWGDDDRRKEEAQ